jgi:hypothetical protein
VDLMLITILDFFYILLVVFILGRFIYYPNQGKPEFLFTYLLMAAIISVLCIIISRVSFSLGFALGIFAVFGIIRYRTLPISPREMTYIFLSAGIAAKNALVLGEIEFYRLVAADIFILATAASAEYFILRKEPSSKLIVYDNLNLIHPDQRPQLMEDLNQRFGISNIKSIKVGKIDAVKNSARLMVYFLDTEDLNYHDD